MTVSKNIAVDKIKKVILSCESFKQLRTARRMIGNFLIMYEDTKLFNYLHNIESLQHESLCSHLITS